MAEKVAVYGGDIRNLYIADFIRKNGYKVRVCCHNDAVCSDYGFANTELNTDLYDADLIILGLPAVKNDMTINCPFSTEKPSFENLLKQIKKSTIIAGGRFSQSAGVMAENYKIKLADYSTDEVFQTENAFYTAEGAIEALIKNTERSLRELNVLITGYGRISKALTHYLRAFGAEVTVYARKKEQRIWADMYGLCVTDELDEAEKYNAVINTVPAVLLEERYIEAMKKDALIIDLSARPGYVDKDVCKMHGINLVFLPGLPSVSAPRSAGEAAARAIIRMYKSLQEEMEHNGA